jgi:hypothetical protein
MHTVVESCKYSQTLDCLGYWWLGGRSRITQNHHILLVNRLFAPAQLLCNWIGQRPISQSDLNLSVTRGGWESLLHKGERASDSIFEQQYMIVVGLRFKWYTLHKSRFCIQ